VAGELLENRARDFVTAFGGLVGIGSSSERDGFVALHAAQLVTQQRGSVLLYVDLLLKLHAVPHLHEFVRVAGVAVSTPEFAAAIGIDGPREGHLTIADAAIEQRFSRKREVFDIVPFAERLAFGSETGNADKLGFI
jgi:hypothetical protein